MSIAIPANLLWTSPFSRWGLSLSNVDSLDFGSSVAKSALEKHNLDPKRIDEIVLGWSVPQRNIFYGAPTFAVKIGAPGISGPMISQACATSVAALKVAAESIRCAKSSRIVLAAVTDRTSNGPTLIYPNPSNPGGSPDAERWVLDSFNADPNTGKAMITTADEVAAAEGISRAELDDVTALRYAQYQKYGGTGDHVVPISIKKRKRTIELTADEGVLTTTKESLAALRPAMPNGIHSFGNQTHPADGAAGAIVTTADIARELSDGAGVVELLGFGVCRVGAARMPTALVPAALAALKAANIDLNAVDLMTTHNPFAVNDVFFSRKTGFPLEKMNTRGCSLVFGHPQGPTGMRSIVELVASLRERGGGVGLFTGCAAGDSGAAVVIRVTD